MEEVIQFALLGLGLGALYALASQGLIVIFRGSGVLNFAYGAVGMVGAYAAWDLNVNAGVAYIPAAVIGVLLCAAIGAAMHLLIMRPLRHASPLARVVSTLGVLLVLQSAALLRYGESNSYWPSKLPLDTIDLTGSISIGQDRVYLLGIACVLTLGLWLLYKYTRFGLATEAAAQDERAASAIGLSPDAIATLNWALGSAIGGAAAILIAPIITLDVTTMTKVVLAALAAALVARFRSFPIALLGGLLLGVAQTELARYVPQAGLSDSVPFIVIVVVLVLGGRSLPLRDHFLQKLPSVGKGQIRWGWAAVGLAATAAAIAFTGVAWIEAITVTLGVATVLLSIVVITGYAGQLSLAQYALAGFGAFVAGRLVATQGVPLWIAAIAGIAATVPLGLLFALPAVRTRGVNLAVVTLGLGSAVELMLFNNGDFTGGGAGTVIPEPTLFGLDIGATLHPSRYGFVALAGFTLAALAVANVRRGRSGRRLIAVRTNERAATALGISVPFVKLYAFGLSAALAALGGVLIAFRNDAMLFSNFTSMLSITAVGLAMIGGIGFVMGSVLGATLAAGAIGTQISNELFSGVSEYLTLISGVVLIVLVLANQNGIAPEILGQLRWLRRRLGIRERDRKADEVDLSAPAGAGAAAGAAKPVTLEARGLTVRFGSTTALEDVSLRVEPGQVVALIGPNGAGKTTLIDAVTGFVTTEAGELFLDGADISGWSAVRRARGGINRSFQSLELFDDSTVLDNLRVASDPRDRHSYVTDLVHPVQPALSDEVRAAITEFRLEDELATEAADLSYGKRRLLSIARTVASNPSVLLLDEPASGLGEAESAELAVLVRRLADEWGLGILLVEHDMTFVMDVSDELVVLDFGRVIAKGPPAEVRRDARVIAAYLGEEADGESAAGVASRATPSATLAEGS